MSVCSCRYFLAPEPHEVDLAFDCVDIVGRLIQVALLHYTLLLFSWNMIGLSLQGLPIKSIHVSSASLESTLWTVQTHFTPSRTNDIASSAACSFSVEVEWGYVFQCAIFHHIWKWSTFEPSFNSFSFLQNSKSEVSSLTFQTRVFFWISCTASSCLGVIVSNLNP